MIKNLRTKDREIILKIINKLYMNEIFPELWSNAIAIPILKKGKSEHDVKSYRLISLTCSMCKLMEKVVSNRLQWFLEYKNLLPPWQSGFRKGRGTRGNLVQLETVILSAFNNGEKLLAIFLDLENAFEKTWRHSILATLKTFGIDGHILAFLSNFLSNRFFHVRCGNIMSDNFVQENGVPQGCVLSALLFCISLNKMIEKVQLPVRAMLYADDIIIYINGKKPSHATRHATRSSKLSI